MKGNEKKPKKVEKKAKHNAAYLAAEESASHIDAKKK